MWIVTSAAAAASTVLASFASGGSQASRTERHSLLRPSYLVGAVILIALAIAAWFWIARPSSSVEAAVAWGLPGVWQRDCDAPVRSDNPRYTYSIEDGKVLLRRDFGGDMKDASLMSDVERTAAGDIQYMVHFTQLGVGRQDRVSRRNVLTRSPEGRIRALANRHEDSGTDSVVGGIRSEDRNPTPWMTRCRSE